MPAYQSSAVSATADLVRSLVNDGLPVGVHDIGNGGLGVALAEMAVRSGVGVTVARIPDHHHLFAESVGRAVVCVAADDLAEVERRAADAGVTATRLGVAGGDRIKVKDLLDIPLDVAVTTWRDRLPEALGGVVASS